MDLLGVCNLINYFGKAQDVEDITISPLLMQKGNIMGSWLIQRVM